MTALVIDGNNLAHRCRHVFSLSYKGKDVSVTFGFLKVISSYLEKFRPTSIIVCWDYGIPEYRRDAIPEYKAQRNHGDPLEYAIFEDQMNELINEALPIMGVISVKKRCAEADDLVYHAAKMITEPVIVISSDKDLIQAVDEHTQVYNPARDTIYNTKMIEEECGVPYYNYIHWRALQGDPSDNIPGVAGIGEKTATKLFQEYKTLTGITNAALGLNPNGLLTGKIASNICSFGLDRIAKNILVMALYADRTGARLAILDSIQDFHPVNKIAVKKYLANNGFVSLMDGNFVMNLARLKEPILAEKLPRTPVICCRRTPA